MTAAGSKKRKREQEPEEATVDKIAVEDTTIKSPVKPKKTPKEAGESMEKDEPEAEAGQTPATLAAPTFSRQLLQLYYNTLFPYEHFFSWLTYRQPGKIDHNAPTDSKYWKKREICFTMEGDIFVRYKSYHTLNEFKSDLKKKLPFKIDIGPVYNIEPKNRKSSCVAPQAEEKELVFDIDITDYDDVRECCSGGACCATCWPLMTCAIKVLDLILGRKFGFKNKLWVFSGRRGVHCWVADPHTLAYTKQIRTAIIRFIHTFTGNDKSTIKCDLRTKEMRGIPNIYEEVYPICEHYFRECILQQQDLFMQVRKVGEEDVPYFKTLLDMVRDEDIRDDMTQTLRDSQPTNSEDVWKVVCTVFEKQAKKFGRVGNKDQQYGGEVVKGNQIPRLLRANRMEMVFAYVFPRVDTEVTKGVNHLLKSPFCIHPKTGKLCVPMDPANVEGFDPSNQVTLATLQQELEANNGDPKKTSMNKAIEVFERTFLHPLQAARA